MPVESERRPFDSEDRPMDVGMMMVFASYGWDNCPDDRVWDEEIRLARIAADSGFDVLWSAEHHFNDYSFVASRPGWWRASQFPSSPWIFPLKAARPRTRLAKRERRILSPA